MKKIFIILAVCLFLQLSGQQYQGFGSLVTGGSGMQVFHVTNLNSSGTGSFRSFIGNNRTIVFDVSGTIENFTWDSSNEFPVKNLTIDGGGKITVKGDISSGNNVISFQAGCSNIILKNIRFRNGGNDGVNITGATDIILDHLSCSGNVDGDCDLTNGARNITITNCLFGSGAPNWNGTMLLAYKPTKNISVYRNLFYSITPAGVGERNPLIHSSNGDPFDTLMCDFRNNLVYKWGRDNGTGSGYGSLVAYKGTANFISNYYYSNSDIGNAIVSNGSYGITPAGHCYANGNFSGNTGISPDNASNHAIFQIPAYAAVNTMDPCSAALFVKMNAGCRPLDQVDQTFISDITLPRCPAALPVSISLFRYNKQINALEWITETEINNDRFEVEVSGDGITWVTIATVNSKADNGNSDRQLNYSYAL